LVARGGTHLQIKLTGLRGETASRLSYRTGCFFTSAYPISKIQGANLCVRPKASIRLLNSLTTNPFNGFFSVSHTVLTCGNTKFVSQKYSQIRQSAQTIRQPHHFQYDHYKVYWYGGWRWRR